MRKHSENNSHQLMSSSEDSLSVGQPIIFTGKEIVSKKSIDADNAYSHEVYSPPQMSIASFGDSACALELAGLIDRGIDPRVSYQRFMGRKVSDIPDLGQECSPGSISNTINGSKYVHFFNHHGLTELSKDAGDLIEAFHQVQEDGYLLGQDKFFSEAVGGDRAFCCGDNRLSAKRNLSAFAGVLQSVSDSASFSGPDATCGGKLLEETEHRFSKDICQGLQLREGGLKHSLDLVFRGSDEVGNGLPLSGQVSEVIDSWGDGELTDGVLVSQKELSDGEGVFLISLGLSEGQFCEIGNQKGIKNCRVDLFGAKEGEEIDMVAACGLHGGAHQREVTRGGPDGFQQSGKAGGIHGGRRGEPDFSFGINTGDGKRILGYINTDKQRVQRTTSLKEYLSKAGEASRPILHGDKDSKIQSTYHGLGRQGADSFKGSTAQNKCSSPACLLFQWVKPIYINVIPQIQCRRF